MRLSLQPLVLVLIVGAALCYSGGCATQTRPTAHADADADHTMDDSSARCTPTNLELPNGDTATICSLNYTVTQNPDDEHVTITLVNGWVIVYGTNTSIVTLDTIAGDDADHDDADRDDADRAKAANVDRGRARPIRQFAGLASSGKTISYFTSDDDFIRQIRLKSGGQPARQLDVNKMVSSRNGVFTEITGVRKPNLRRPGAHQIHRLLSSL